jgi:aminocarboxymuconate-semialdehyde decarboxylase
LLTGYGRTVARKHGPLGRDVRPQTVTIDIHSHVSVPEAAAHVGRYLGSSANPLALFSTPETKAVNAQQEVDRRSRMTGHNDGLSERLRDLDHMGIDIQVVMPPPPQCYYTVPIDISVKLVRS